MILLLCGNVPEVGRLVLHVHVYVEQQWSKMCLNILAVVRQPVLILSALIMLKIFVLFLK